MRPQLIVYIEPSHKSKFYKSLEKYLLASLAYYGLHEGAMYPPHCDLTKVIPKGNEQKAEDVANILNTSVQKFAPYNRPIISPLNRIDKTSERDGFFGIPLKLFYYNVGVKTNKYEYCLKDFTYEMGKQMNMEVYPPNLHKAFIPLGYNIDHFLTKDKRLTLKELEGMLELAGEMIDFQDATTCAWYITLHQIRPSMYFNHPHHFDAPVQTWEICPQIVSKKKWDMDWPI